MAGYRGHIAGGPDVDTKSKGQSLFYWLVFTIDVLLIWNKQIQAAAYLGIIALLPLLSKHRGCGRIV